MKAISILLITVILPFAAMAGEVNIALDRLAVLNSQDDANAESKLAIHFVLPGDSIRGEVVYAEIIISVPVAPLRTDSLFELLLFPLTTDWREDDIDFERSEAITDSVLIGCHMVKLGTPDIFRIDITPFIKEVLAGERNNYGFIAVADLLGDYNIGLPESVGEVLRRAVRVRVIYK